MDEESIHEIKQMNMNKVQTEIKSERKKERDNLRHGILKKISVLKRRGHSKKT